MRTTSIPVDLTPALERAIDQLTAATVQVIQLHEWCQALDSWGYSRIEVVTPYPIAEDTPPYVRCLSPRGRDRIVRTAEDFGRLELVARFVRTLRRPS